MGLRTNIERVIEKVEVGKSESRKTNRKIRQVGLSEIWYITVFPP
jgi:hypothetical protein